MTSRAARKREQRARTVRTVIVPDFPEIVNREEQCRLCTLVDKDPELLRHIHDAWKSGKGVRALETETTTLWAERGEAVPNVQSFARHFKKHIDFEAAAVGELLEEDFLPPPPGDTPAPTAIAERPKTSSPEGVLPHAPPPKVELVKPRPEDEEAGAADYFDMENVIRRLRARLEQIDQDTSFVDESGRVNTYGIVIWLKLVSEMRQALESYNRMKNSDRLTKAILQAHTKRFSQLLSQPLITRFEVVLGSLKADAMPNAVAELEKLAREDIKQIVLKAADESVRESVEVYKLH